MISAKRSNFAFTSKAITYIIKVLIFKFNTATINFFLLISFIFLIVNKTLTII